MGTITFLFLMMFFSVIFQVFAGSYGFFIPIAGCTTFYIAVTYGWRGGIIAAIVQGLAIDFIYFRYWLLSAPILLAVTGMAQIWLWRVDGKSLWAKVFPGMIIAALCTLPPTLANIGRGGGSIDEFLQEMMSWIFTLMISAVLLPLLIFVADEVSEHLGLPGFERAREKLIHRR